MGAESIPLENAETTPRMKPQQRPKSMFWNVPVRKKGKLSYTVLRILTWMDTLILPDPDLQLWLIHSDPI